MDQAEASGKTVEDALNRALAKLGAHRDEVEFVVLDEGRKGGLFGRGAKEAVVRVERVAGGQPQPTISQAPDTRIPHGNQRGGRGNRGRGGERNQRTPNERPPAPDRGANVDRAATPDRGRGRNGTRRTSTRAGFDNAAPKLQDTDFTRPNYDDESGQLEAAAPAPAPAAGRARRGRGGENHDRQHSEHDDRPERSERSRGDRSERRRREDEPRIEPDINAEEVDFAAQTVDDILRILEIDAELSIREPVTHGDGLGTVLAVIDIKGDDLGLLIGRRGDTLLSLQYLVNLILARRYPGKGGVTIDVEHYRHRREEQVVSLAQRMAERVRETGSPITLEPMSASERRIVHLTFAEDSDLETNSVGEGENRKVVISARR
jgi:spoIIIJ-associated protein